MSAAAQQEARVARRRWLPAFVDEALALREWRRARRWLLGSGLPLWYVLGTVLLPWLVVPALSAAVAGWSGQAPLQSQPRWMFLTLAMTLVGGGMATAFARVSQLWHTERTQHTLEGWLLARQESIPLVVTAALAGAALALIVSSPGAVLLAGIGISLGVRASQTLLSVGLLILGAALAAAGATAAFFMTTLAPSPPRPVPPSPRRPVAPSLALGALLILVLGLWLQIEAVEHGWGRPWEEHAGRLLLAVGLLTPAPVLIGFADRRWWVFRVVERLDFPITPEATALLLLVLYAVGTLALLQWSERSYRLLRADPERGHRAAPDALAGTESSEAHSRGYWGGFANPVWTRELRTRLRGREAPQFIFFASVTLAVGGFTPLVSAAGQLGDPLETATVARDVFFYLAMTLASLIVLVAPGLTAEAIGTERTRGTLELLLAAPLQRNAILRGKLLGDLSVLALLVSPSLPLFGFCYLFHGASGPQVVGVFLVLGLTAVMCGVLGVTASALNARMMAAKWQAYLLGLLLCCFWGGPLWLMYSLVSSASDSAGAAALAPVFLTVCGVVLASLWSRACERLQYIDPGDG